MKNLIALHNHPATHVMFFLFFTALSTVVFLDHHPREIVQIFAGILGLFIIFWAVWLLLFGTSLPVFSSPFCFAVSFLLVLLSTQMPPMEAVRIVDGAETRTIDGLVSLPLTIAAFMQALSTVSAGLSLIEWMSDPLKNLFQSIRPTKSGDSQ